MAHLSIALLGTFEVVLDNHPVTDFAYDKVRALLAYLAIEADRTHRRETLSGLLWPEHDQHRANRNLSQSLFKLRQSLSGPEASPPFLLITSKTVQFNTAGDTTLDVTTFTTLLAGCADHAPHPLAGCDLCLSQCQQAVALYRDSFLAGFSIGNSPGFSEWTTLHRERLHRLAVQALRRIVVCMQERQQYQEALPYAWRWIALEPWQEEGHRQLMHLLTLSGQRSTALTQYETCRRLLQDELGIEPAEKTTQLYRQIRDRRLSVADVPAAQSASSTYTPATPSASFLPAQPTSSGPKLPFVARNDELAQLNQYLDVALSGQSQFIFVTGEAGQGKTALIQEFAQQAQSTHPPLIMAQGSSSVHTGTGDPYQPFHEILALLTGHLETYGDAGRMSYEQANRLQQLLPSTVQILLDCGPDLVNTLLPGTALLKRAKAHVPQGDAWLTQLEELVVHKAATPPDPNLQQNTLFEQVFQLLKTLAGHVPLLLLLDDLQWIDAASAGLLFHLGRRLTGSRIMLLGAYRPAEVAQGRNNKRHPLEPVVNELKRCYGPIEINLNRAEGRCFIDAWLDTEPNHLNHTFRQTLYRQTQGQPLFTIELLRAMQARGNLIRDKHGHWIEGSTMDWNILPERVEAVIAERIAQLPDSLRETLTVAGVEGETFTAEVVAKIKQVDDWSITRQLDDKLARTYRLIQAGGVRQLEGRCLSTYSFRHNLFQQYLYNSLGPTERIHLHQAVGETLETLYGQDTAEVVLHLARHFQQAGNNRKAITYLQQAGQDAARRSAHIAAVGHLTKSLTLLQTLPSTLERDQQELALQIALGTSLIATKGFGDAAVERAFSRAQDLCQRVFTTDTVEHFLVLRGLGAFYTARAQHKKVVETGERMWQIAQSLQDATLEMEANRILGGGLFGLSQLTRACIPLEQVIDKYEAKKHHALAFRSGLDSGVVSLSWAAWTLWLLGYPDQALQRSREAVALAQEIAHPFSLGFALIFAAGLYEWRGELALAQQESETAIHLAMEHSFTLWLGTATFWRGLVIAELGLAAGQKQIEEGMAHMQKGLAIYRATGTRVQLQLVLGSMAGVLGKIGQIKEGLTLLTEALTVMDTTDERYWEAELVRIRGELLLAQDGTGMTEAEDCFRQAREIARQQKAKSLELRAAMSLGRLWHAQERTTEAQQMLEEIYGRFSEGFDTGDLREARALLEEIATLQDESCNSEKL